jgi:energy-coupling factor transporter ATP-binding protein EcfA2
MRLKSLFMGHFGLFRGRLVEFGPGLNLIFGPNESGKTTLVDAIVVSLLARSQKKGGSLKSIPRALAPLKERYGTDISLQMMVEHHGQKAEFPSPRNFQDRWDLGWDELRAIFIAREGELDLATGSAREFRNWWSSLKGKLLGFEEEPRKVLSKIAAEANLTDNLGLTVIQKDRREEIQKKLDWFSENEERIMALRELVRQDRDLEAREKRLAGQVEAAEQGLRKSKLLRAKGTYDRMKQAQARLAEEFARYSEKDAREWEKLAQEMEKQSARVQWLRQQREKEESKHRQAIERAAELARRVNALSRTLQAAAEKEQELAEVVVADRKRQAGAVPPWAPWACWAVALLSLMLGVHSDILGLLLFGVGLVGLALLLTYLLHRQSRIMGQFVQRRDGLIRWGHEVGLNAETVPDLLKKKMEIQQQRDELEGQRKEMEAQLPKLTKAVDDLARQEKARLAEVERARQKIRHLRDRMGLADLEALEQKLKGKKELLGDVEKKFKSSLRELLGAEEGAWSRELDRLKELEEVVPTEDAAAVGTLADQLEDCRRQKRDVFEQLTGLTAELKAHFGCQRLEEVLWKVEDLRGELEDLDTLEQAGQKVRETFERVLQQSDGILDDIIGGEEVCRRFRKITGDRYRSVSMDDLNLRITDDRDRQWDFAHLSSGTRDQLLTVLRLVLAERRLGGKGFLILDDPLVNSDRRRLGEQMDLLGRLAREGWQILFLTAQDEIYREAERLAGDGTDVRFIDLQAGDAADRPEP